MRARCLGSMSTVRLWNGTVSTDREHLEGFKKVVYTRHEQVWDVLQRVVKRSLCRLVWEVRWMKSQSAWYPMWNRRPLRIQLHEGWKGKLMNAEHSEPGKKHSYMSDSVPVKRVTAVLHAREDVQRASSLETVRNSPEGVNAEVWRKQASNTNLALVSDTT